MGIFDDKKYEELDWISQAVEPVESDLLGAIATVPDEVEVDFELYKELSNSSFDRDVRLRYCIDAFMTRFAKRNLTYNERTLVNKVFSFSVEPGTLINFKEKKVIGSIKIIKDAQKIDERDLISLIGLSVVDRIDQLNHVRQRPEMVSRMSEVLEMLGCTDNAVLRSRSYRTKLSGIRVRIKSIFKEDQWRIRNPELATKIGYWIHDYVECGNLAAWSNFCRLKLMTHNGKAIYSVQEVE